MSLSQSLLTSNVNIWENTPKYCDAPWSAVVFLIDVGKCVRWFLENPDDDIRKNKKLQLNNILALQMWSGEIQKLEKLDCLLIVQNKAF